MRVAMAASSCAVFQIIESFVDQVAPSCTANATLYKSADISVQFYPYRAIEYREVIICAVDAFPDCMLPGMRPTSSCHSHLMTDMLLQVHGEGLSCSSRNDTDAAGLCRSVARERQEVKAVHRCRRQLTE